MRHMLRHTAPQAHKQPVWTAGATDTLHRDHPWGLDQKHVVRTHLQSLPGAPHRHPRQGAPPMEKHGMVFPVVMYGYESWTIKKAEPLGIDAFELWPQKLFEA